MRRGIITMGIALLLGLGVIGLATGGPANDIGVATALAQAGPENVAPPPGGYGYGYGYGPGWGYGHGFSPFGFFLAPLFFLFWLVLPVGIVLFLLKARRHFGGGNPPWLTEWHRRMHERDVTSPPPGTSRPDVQAEGSGTA